MFHHVSFSTGRLRLNVALMLCSATLTEEPVGWAGVDIPFSWLPFPWRRLLLAFPVFDVDYFDIE